MRAKFIKILTFGFIFLLAVGYSQGLAADISGLWDIQEEGPACNMHMTIRTVDPEGQTHISESENPVYLFVNDYMDVMQNQDGVLSGARSYADETLESTTELSGRINLDTVEFKITSLTKSKISNSNQASIKTYTGKLKNGVISGSVILDYAISKEIHSGGYSTYISGNGQAAGTFRIELEEGKVDTEIIDDPGETIESKTAKFEFSGTSPNGIAGFYYQLDSQPKVYTALTSVTLSGLNLGAHVFSVAAQDNIGIIDETPATWSFNIVQAALPNPPQDSQNGRTKPDEQTVGDPINSVTGNMHIMESDLAIPGRGLHFDFTRTFNSASSEISSIGRGWTHSYNVYLNLKPADAPVGTNYLKIKDEESKGYFFADNSNGTFTSQRGEHSKLTKSPTGYIWTKKDGKQYIFNLSGRLSQIKDRCGNAVTLTYDTNSRLIKITDTVGRQINLSYDNLNRLIRLSGPLSKVFDYSYDANNNLIKVKDPAGNYLSCAYDSNNRLIRKTDKRGNSAYFTYDSEGRCNSSMGENNIGKTELNFDPLNKKTEIRDSKGNLTTHYYNADNLLTRIVDAQGNEKLLEWDSSFNLISTTDQLGHKTLMQYDTRGNLTKLTDALGNATAFTYEPNFNLLISLTDSLGNVTTNTYDAKGNLLKVVDSQAGVTSSTYSAYGQILTTTNPLGKISYFAYNAQGDLSSTKNALGFVTIYTYDVIGNLLQTQDAKGYITKYAYDTLNQLIKVTYPDNSIITYTYDANGNKTSVTDQLGAVTTSVYDQDDRLKSVTDPLDHMVTNEYDTEGNLIAVIDQNNNRTTYEYDSLNRLISQINALGFKTEYTYDAVGNRISSTDAKRQNISYVYDELNRLVSEDFSLDIALPGSIVAYTYDVLGRRASMTDSRGTTTYGYDKLGRLLQVDGPEAKDTLTYTYDKVGNRLTMVDPDGKTTTYAYDAINRLISITDPQGKITKYAYDALNNVISTALPNSTSASYTYDNLNRLLKLVNQKGVTKLSEFVYTYDKVGRKLTATTLDGKITYAYDALGQIILEQGLSPQGTVTDYLITYAYDAAGNRLSMFDTGREHTYEYNSLNQLTRETTRGEIGLSLVKRISVSGTVTDSSGIKSVMVNGTSAALSGSAFTANNILLNLGKNTLTVNAVDKLDNSSSKSISVTYDPYAGTTPEEIRYSYDENGNLIAKQKGSSTANFIYDQDNRLISVSGAGVNSTYVYDGDGRRILTKEGAVTTNYLYDGQSVIIERNTSDTTTTTYIRNPFAAGGIGGILKRLSPQETVSEVYYHYDGIGSVVNLTNSVGAVIQSYAYDAFGNLKRLSPTGTVPVKQQFLTKEVGSFGLVYFGARYYDPRIGRFISEDPSGMSDGPNLYLYCNNDPVNYVDLWGLCKDKKWADYFWDAFWRDIRNDVYKGLTSEESMELGIQMAMGFSGGTKFVGKLPVVYRQGSFAAGSYIKGKKWAPKNPATTKGYAKKYGLPMENSGKPDWIIKGRVRGGYTSGPAPASHNAPKNTGRAIEIIPNNPDDVLLDSFYMP